MYLNFMLILLLNDEPVYPLHYISIHLSYSIEANWFLASQEIPRILWNPKLH